MNYTYDPLNNEISLDNFVKDNVFNYYLEVKLYGSIKNLSFEASQKFKYIEERFNYLINFAKNLKLTEQERLQYIINIKKNFKKEKLEILDESKKINKNVFVNYYKNKVKLVLLEIEEENKTWSNGSYRSPEDAFNIEQIDFLSYICYKINMIKNENYEIISNIEFTDEFKILENELISIK